LNTKSQKEEEIKKEIFLPPFFGDWTTFSLPEKNRNISISKFLTDSKKTFSESEYDNLLLLHHDLFQSFFKKLSKKINYHIDFERISIELSNQKTLSKKFNTDIYQCKYKIQQLNQIDLVITNKSAHFLCHRLCGGASAPNHNTPLTNVEISVISIINNLMLQEISDHWKQIFLPPSNAKHVINYGNYKYNPQQAAQDSVIEVTGNFKLFQQAGLSIKLLYSMESMEKLLDLSKNLTSSIEEKITLNESTLKKTTVNSKSIIGKTTLSIEEIQSLEVGDIIILDNHNVKNPIRLSFDETNHFNVMPVKTNEEKIGVQIIDAINYNKYQMDINLPKSGPLIIEAKENLETPTATTKNETEDSNNTEDEDIATEDIATDTDDEDIAEKTAEVDEEEDIEMNEEEEEDDDNFEWDDLDDD
jgi:flagellar motor switch protein FliM